MRKPWLIIDLTTDGSNDFIGSPLKNYCQKSTKLDDI